ncbi:MAG TPA: UvrB/UvrC motif-containing protein [Thermoanaerobaculaceae bacterium]|nr:UvrB/UvrC motif-containing protein [Thermoanaerobaculaceae bacterium]
MARSSARDSPFLALRNLGCHDGAFRPPRVAEVDVSDAASLAKAIAELERDMKAAAKRLEFNEAAQLRDGIKELCAQQIYKS